MSDLMLISFRASTILRVSGDRAQAKARTQARPLSMLLQQHHVGLTPRDVVEFKRVQEEPIREEWAEKLGA
jgi:hypothetical protein